MMTPAFQHLSRLGLVLCLAAATAWGHDPLEITTTAYLYSNRMELRIVTTAKTARLLAGGQGGRAVWDSESEFAAVQPVFMAHAPGLCEIRADGKPLAATGTNVVLLPESHVEFRITYPRPANGPLRIDAVHLRKLPREDNYGMSLTVLDMANHTVLGQQLLKPEDTAWQTVLQKRAATNSAPAVIKTGP